MFLSAVNRLQLAVFKCVTFTDATFSTFISAKLWWTKHISARPKHITQTDLTEFLRCVCFLIAWDAFNPYYVFLLWLEGSMGLNLLVNTIFLFVVSSFPSSVYQLVVGIVVDVIQNIIRDMYACGAWCLSL